MEMDPVSPGKKSPVAEQMGTARTPGLWSGIKKFGMSVGFSGVTLFIRQNNV